MKKIHIIRFLVLGLWCLGTCPLFAKTENTDWYEPLPPLTWQDAPLRPTLRNWCRAENVPLLVDCRVDPNTLLAGTFQHASRITILQEVLRNASTEEKPLQLTQLDGVLYIGPASYASKLQTLSVQMHEKVRTLSPGKQKIWLKKAPLRWENRATPREILQELARKNRLKFSETKLIPHDLWVETELPPLDLIDRMILVLGQLGLTFRVDEEKPTHIELLPLDEKRLYWEKSYPNAPSLEEKLATIRENFPDTQIRASGKRIQVRGIAEIHTFLASDETLCCVGAFRQGKSSVARTSAGIDRKLLRISGKVSGTFLPVLKQFCEQQGYTLEFDANSLLKAGISLEQRVSLEVQEVTPDEFLHRFAERAGCRVSIEKNRVRLLAP
ncbi:MAG: hypothetical protein Q4D62_15525 [Planctomycetia bacterium]|nr:hypothetical protein [Planctomycetia bacterium]